MENINIYEFQEIRINSLDELYAYVEAYDRAHNLPRTVYEGEPPIQAFYRGQPNSVYDITPSILRSKPPELSEGEFIRKYTPSDDMSLFEAISYIQHYYTGTRFIDFSTSPDIALYFACQTKPDKPADGALFMYCYAPHRAEWYSSMILTEVAALESEEKISIKVLAEKLMIKYPQIKRGFNSTDELSMAIVSFLDHGFMAVPDEATCSNNQRLKRQQGCFYICSVKFEHELDKQDRWQSRAGNQVFFPESAIVPESLKSKSPLVKLIIPHELKPSILEHLKRKGVTKEYLFPD